MENESTGKLTKKQLFGYAFGAIPAGLLMYVFNLKYIELFYDDLRLIPILFIIGQVIYLIINALNNPLMGQLSDRTNRERWGSRRILYIKYGGAIWILSFLIIWFPWSYDDQIIIFLHYVISICLFDTMFSLCVMCWMALLPEMTSDTGERIKANFLGLILGAVSVVPFLIILGSMEVLSLTFQMFMVLVAIIASVFLILVVVMCKEKPEFQKDESLPLGKSVKETLKSKSFRFYIGYNFCMVFIVGIGISYLFAYSFVLGDNVALYFLIFIGFGYTSYFVCLKLQPIWGMRRVILRFGVIRVIGTLAIFFLMLLTGLEWMIWIGFIVFTFFGGYNVYTMAALLYLSVDEDEIIHRTRREGMFLGINALITKPALSLGPIIATVIFLYFGYVQGSEVQSDNALLGIKILFLVIPAIATAISLIFIYFYPLHGERLIEMKSQLDVLHKEKIAKIQRSSA